MFICISKRYDRFKIKSNFNSVYFIEPPKISKDYLPMKTANEGTYFTFTCSVLTGSQPLFFDWFKDGQIITSQSKDIQLLSIGKMQSNLIIEALGLVMTQTPYLLF